VLPSATRASGTRLLAEQRDQYACELNALVRRGLLLGLRPHEIRRMVTSAVAAARSGIEVDSTSATRPGNATRHGDRPPLTNRGNAR
jgi:hypothetical protein